MGIKIYSQTLTPKEFDSLLIEVNKKLVGKKSFEEVIRWNEELLEKAKKQNYIKGIAWANINIANRYWNQGKSDLCIRHLNEVNEMVKRGILTDNYTISKMHQEYSQNYYIVSLYGLSLKNSSKAIYYAKKIEENPSSCNVRERHLSYVYSCRANTLYETKKLDSALVYLQKSNFYFKTPMGYAAIANHYTEYQSNLDSAKIYLDNAVTLINNKDKNATTYNTSVVYFYYGNYYTKRRDYKNAADYLENSRLLAEKAGNTLHRENVYRLLADTYKNLNDVKKEKENLTRYAILKDSTDVSQAKGVELSMKSLEKEKDEHNEIIKRNALYYGAAIVIISLIVFTYFYIENKKKKKKIIEKETVIVSKEKEAKVLERKVSSAFEEVMGLAKTNDKSFLVKFQEIYPEFIKKLSEINPDLTQSDFVFSAYIFLGFSSKEIATYTYTQHRSMQTKKTRLRKKLALDSDIDLYVYFKSII